MQELRSGFGSYSDLFNFVYSYSGFNIGGSGNVAIRFRPALILEPSDVNMFLDSFDKVLKEL